MWICFGMSMLHLKVLITDSFETAKSLYCDTDTQNNIDFFCSEDIFHWLEKVRRYDYLETCQGERCYHSSTPLQINWFKFHHEH